MKRKRCVIVDDEPLACESLRTLLAGLPGVEVAGVAHRVEAAVQAVRDHDPDLMFLDIQMPGGGGFEILRRLESPPPTIFVTAHDQYAVRAFEVYAVDYLLKPVLPERLAEALARVGIGAPRTGRRPASSAVPLTAHDLVLLELGRTGHFRKVHDLLCIQADGKYTHILCSDGMDYVVRRGIDEWESLLPRDLFLRLDRGVLVNRGRIQRIDPDGREAVLVLGRDQHTVRLGRSAATRLRRALDGMGT